MTVWVGTASGNQVVTDPKVGTGSGRMDVTKIWVGDAGSVPRLVFDRAGGGTPPGGGPSTQQKVWLGNAVQSATYRESGANRGVAECFYGRYSSSYGVQRSLARWEFPADMRNCVSIDAVELQWYNLHTYVTSGGQVSLTVHWAGDLAGNHPGSSDLLRNPANAGDPVQSWAAPKPGQINNTPYFHLGWLHAAGRPTVAEEIRVHNAQGFGLSAATTAQSGYGYARGASQGPITARITYTVQV